MRSCYLTMPLDLRLGQQTMDDEAIHMWLLSPQRQVPLTDHLSRQIHSQQPWVRHAISKSRVEFSATLTSNHSGVHSADKLSACLCDWHRHEKELYGLARFVPALSGNRNSRTAKSPTKTVQTPTSHRLILHYHARKYIGFIYRSSEF